MRQLIIAALLVLTVAGCNRFPDNGLQIAAIVPPDDNCTVDADTEVRRARGLWDLDFPADYFIIPVLESYLLDNSLEFQAPQNNIQVTNFEITLLLPDGTQADLGGLVNPYTVNTSAVIPVTEGDEANSEAAIAVGIPQAYQEALRALGVPTVLLDIRAIGTTFGGFTQKSAPFVWPVDLCEGCLDFCVVDDEGDTVCLPGQDGDPYCSAITP